MPRQTRSPQWRTSRMVLGRSEVLLVGTALLLGSPGVVAQENTVRNVELHHGSSVELLQVTLGSGAVQQAVPQALVYEQGTRVCLRIGNANPVWFNYSLGKAERSLEPTDAELAPLSDVAKALAKRGIDKPDPGAGVSAAVAPQQRTAEWLLTYASHLYYLRDTVAQAQAARAQSESPERSPKSAPDGPGGSEKVGYRWAKQVLDSLLSPVRRETWKKRLETWRTQARAGWDKERTSGGRAGGGADDSSAAVLAIEALDDFGKTLLARAQSIAAEFAGDGVWSDCATLGKDELTLRLTVTRKADGDPKYRALPTAADIITVTPRYAWKTVDVVSGLGIVVIPGGRAFAVRNDVVRDDGSETLIRPMVAVTVPFHSFGGRGQNAWVAVIGASALDLQGKPNAGNVLGQLGLGIRVQEILSLSGGLTYGDRPIGLKAGAAVGEPLPSSFETLSDATETAAKVGFFFQVAFRGLSL
jgi:hypothetical protein